MGGTRAGGRCNINQFLEYIWKPQGPETEADRPKVNIFSDTLDITSKKIVWLVNEMVKAAKSKGTKVTGNSDNARLLPGSTDYYDCLGKTGTAVGEANARLNTLEKQFGAMDPASIDYASKKQTLAGGRSLVANAKKSSRVITDLRAVDMDKYRIGGLNKWLELQNPGAGLKVETMPGRAEEDTKNLLGKPYESYDAIGTKNKYIGAHPDIEALLAAAEKAWMEDPGPKKDYGNRNHFSAHQSALKAEGGCNC